MEERDDYPIIPQPEKEPKKYPDFNEWIKEGEGLKCMEWPISESKYLHNRLFWAFDAGRNCVWHQYLDQKKELASLKEVVKELIPIAVDAVDWQYFHGIQTKVEEYQKVIDRAKTLLR